MPESRRRLFGIYVDALYSPERPLSTRRYVFYLLLLPALGWALRALIEEGLEPDEAESEIFLLTNLLFEGYNPEKSSLLYYVESRLPWRVAELIEHIGRHKSEIPVGLLLPIEDSYEMPDEIYLSAPQILFEDRWLAKGLSRHEKHLILRVLTEEELDCRSLADTCQIGKSTMNNRLRDLASRLEERF
jgi:hypothetical protein